MNNQKNDLVKREEEILAYWQDNKIFEKTLEQTKDNELYSFYDGPPFATGTPHYGHLVASIMKDAVPRYQTMNGKYVERRWGWDCHGLPIENIVEKKLNLKSRKDIEDLGVEKFNNEAKKNVLTYADEWKKTIPRLGRWVDMENDYKTMEPWYMESIWWVFKELWDKDLIYEDYKSMHICPRCETTLSNFEVTQGYKDVKDLSVTVSFRIMNHELRIKDLPTELDILAWTTTPWTLIGNVALAINDNIKYVIVKSEDKNYIMAKDRVEDFFSNNYEIVKEIKGKDLVGLKYEPLFDYYKDKDLENNENLYAVVSADFVSTEDGTGVVHIAPAFGEDDMNLAREKNLPLIQHVDMSGRFKDEVKDFAGLEVKPKETPQATDKKVIDLLSDKVFVSEEYEHSYPHCWRCDTPLINYATSSWFVKVTEIKDKIIKNNKEIHWMPDHLKEGRFGKWLEDARDWAISRSRYWGAPLPVWRCKSAKSKSQNGCGATVVIGSIEELEKLAGEKISDLHKHTVDEITFKCEKCGGTMTRIPEVLDCWFESGSMPYAQMHYPFENKEKFEKSFPAEFIAEGVDQTRGWFYTLMVLSTALFDKPAFKNVIVNGIVLAKDGNKMSKRLQNYPEPNLIIDKYGADALRHYLLSAPVMLAENMNFSEDGVKESFQKVVMLLNNILRFYKMYDNSENKKQKTDNRLPTTDHILDNWLLAKFNLLVSDTTKAMDNYDLPRAVRPIGKFIDEFSTWWLRRSRDRFKSENKKDRQQALTVFGYILKELAKVMAPFTPFLADYVYCQVGKDKKSVHLEAWPQSDNNRIDKKILDNMDKTRDIVEMGLADRAKAGIKIRQVLATLTVVGYDLSDEYAKLIADEVNVKNVVFKKGGEAKTELDTELTEELKAEGVLRELIRAVNGMRKKAGLTINDKIKLKWQTEGDIAYKVLKDDMMSEELARSVLADVIEEGDIDDNEKEINGEFVKLEIEKV